MKTTQPKVEVKRFMKLINEVDAQGFGLLKITQVRGSKAECDIYRLQTFVAYQDLVGVVVTNICDDTRYECCVGSRAEETCSCPGHTYGGKCKHVDALRTLYRMGKLPLPAVEANDDF